MLWENIRCELSARYHKWGFFNFHSFIHPILEYELKVRSYPNPLRSFESIEIRTNEKFLRLTSLYKNVRYLKIQGRKAQPTRLEFPVGFKAQVTPMVHLQSEAKTLFF